MARGLLTALVLVTSKMVCTERDLEEDGGGKGVCWSDSPAEWM